MGSRNPRPGDAESAKRREEEDRDFLAERIAMKIYDAGMSETEATADARRDLIRWRELQEPKQWRILP